MPIGGILKGPTARLRAAKTILWCVSPTRTPWHTPTGWGAVCPPRHNGNTPRAGGRDGEDDWSSAFEADGKPIANTWQGIFPVINTEEDGYAGTAPVGCF